MFNNLEHERSKLIEPNQEDVDLIVATEDHLVLIEAKAYESFDEEQWNSKVDRLSLVYEFSRPLAVKRNREIHFRLLLISPKEPRMKRSWPAWAYDGSVPPSTIPWIELPLGPRLEVTRCNQDGKESAGGRFWRYRDAAVAGLRRTAQTSGS